MKWTIDKQFSWCAGHRTWTQQLITGYAEENFCLSCRRLHGHEYTVHVFLECEKLNSQQMVTDFRNLAWFKSFLDNVLDHKFVIDKNDPLIKVILNGQFESNTSFSSNVVVQNIPIIDVKCAGVDIEIGQYLDTFNMDTLYSEFYDSFVLVDFCPTSENLSKWLFHIVKDKMAKIGIDVVRLDLFETPKSRSTYSV